MTEKRASDGYVGFGNSSSEAPRIYSWGYSQEPRRTAEQHDDLNAPYEGYRKPRQALIVVFTMIVFISSCLYVQWSNGQASAEASGPAPTATGR